MTITAVDNATDEPNKTVTVLSATAANSQGVDVDTNLYSDNYSVRIIDDDPAPSVTLVLSPSTINESGASNASTVTATLNHPSSQATTITVSATQVPPAVAGDFSLSSSTTLTIAASATTSTGLVTITAVDNATDAPNKTVTVWATAANSQGIAGDPSNKTLTIADDDEPTVTLVLSPSTINESGASNVSTVTATLSNPSSQATTITVAAAAVVPAVAGDFTLSSSTTLTIAASATTSTGLVTITAVNNATDAPNKTVTVSATAANSQGIAGNPSNKTLTIEDDDASPSVTLVLSPSTINESGASNVSTVTATLSNPSSQATTITVAAAAVVPAVAGDFTLSSSTTLTIAASATTSTGLVTITAVNNATGRAE